MKLTHLSQNHFMISDADAGKLARASGHPLPREGYESQVKLPNGVKVWMNRTSTLGSGFNKRGWVWCVYSNSDVVKGAEKQRDGSYRV
jgi:hypothetical protein